MESKKWRVFPHKIRWSIFPLTLGRKSFSELELVSEFLMELGDLFDWLMPMWSSNKEMVPSREFLGRTSSASLHRSRTLFQSKWYEIDWGGFPPQSEKCHQTKKILDPLAQYVKVKLETGHIAHR